LLRISLHSNFQYPGQFIKNQRIGKQVVDCLVVEVKNEGKGIPQIWVLINEPTLNQLLVNQYIDKFP
jgi:hypothetical protein